MRAILIDRHGVGKKEYKMNKTYLSDEMTYDRAIEVIQEMATELQISPTSLNGRALMMAIEALMIQRDYATKPI